MPLALQQYEALTKRQLVADIFPKIRRCRATIPLTGNTVMAKKAALKWPDDASSLALLGAGSSRHKQAG